MRQRLSIALGLAAFALFAAAQQANTSHSLQVKLNYTGSGTVDEKHKIFIFVFDSPDFMQQGNVMPIASQSATSKNQAVTISGLSPETVYVITAFDPTGGYDGQSGPPPSGSSLGLYSKEPGMPAPVKLEAGKTTTIDLAFDDSFKMP